MNVQVVALIPVLSLKTPAIIPPNIPPTSNTVDKTELVLSERFAKKYFSETFIKLNA